jgi:PKD repeat protein/outer membrane protein assembly factor BamB
MASEVEWNHGGFSSSPSPQEFRSMRSRSSPEPSVADRTSIRRFAALFGIAFVGLFLTALPAGFTGAVHPGDPVHPSGAAHAVPAVPLASPSLRPSASTGAIAWQNWPTYLGTPQRTSANLNETTIAPSNVSHLALRWSLALNNDVYASPAIVNGTVYVGSWNGYEYAINLSSGLVDWKTFLGLNPDCYVGGIDSSSTVWNNSVYVGGGSDYWYALNDTTGSIEWKVYVGDDTNGNNNWASPLLYHGSAYIGIASCEDAPLVWGRLLQVNLTGNHTVFHAFDVVPKSVLAGSIWSSPSVDPATNTVFVSTGNDNGVITNENYTESIVALNATTLQLIGWYRVPNVVGYDQDFAASPIVFHDSTGRTLVGALNKDGIFYCLNATNATKNGSWGPIWTFDTGGAYDQYSPAAFGNGTLYISAAGLINGTAYSTALYALDPATGHVRWEKGSNNGTMYGAVTYANGLTYNPVGNTVEVRSAVSGTLRYSFNVDPRSLGLVMAGSLAVVDGQVVFGTGNGLGGGTAGTIDDLGLPFEGNGTAGPSGMDANVPIQCSANATGGLPPYSANWSFGDGTYGTGLHASHVYGIGGTYEIVLNLTDERGSRAFRFFNVSVNAPLGATIHVSPTSTGYAPFTVTLTSTLKGGTSGNQYLWTFGDGSANSTAASPVHTYFRPGTYSVNLTATDGAGGSANATALVSSVLRPPIRLFVNASATAGDAPLTIVLNATSAGGVAPGAPSWEFGDGGTGVGALVTHTFENAGNYSVNASVSDSLGQNAYSSIPVSVAPPLEVSLTSSPKGAFCPAGTEGYTFTASVSGGTSPFGYEWVYGDGASAAGGSVAEHSYSTSGIDYVSVIVTDGTNTTASATVAVAVPTPNCGGGSHGTIPPATATPSGNTIPTWAWPAVAVVVVAIFGAAIWFLRPRRKVPPRTSGSTPRVSTSPRR